MATVSREMGPAEETGGKGTYGERSGTVQLRSVDDEGDQSQADFGAADRGDARGFGARRIAVTTGEGNPCGGTQ